MRTHIPLIPGTTARDLIDAGVAVGTAWRAVTRGYLTHEYHVRTMATEGVDQLSTCLGVDGVYLLNLSVAVVRNVIEIYGYTLSTIGELDPGSTEFEDLVQAGAMRCLELRAHPHGSKAWYGRVIANETRAAVRRAWQRRSAFLPALKCGISCTKV